MFQLLLTFFVLGLGYAQFTDLVVLPFLAVLGFVLFCGGHMPLPKFGQKPLAGGLLHTLLFFFLFALIFPASIWFSEFRSFRSIADLLFIAVFFMEIIIGAVAVMAIVPWILKADHPVQRQWRSYAVIGPLIATAIGYCIFTAWRHHVGYHP